MVWQDEKTTLSWWVEIDGAVYSCHLAQWRGKGKIYCYVNRMFDEKIPESARKLLAQLATGTRNVLLRNGFWTRSAIERAPDVLLLALPCFGSKSLAEVRSQFPHQVAVKKIGEIGDRDVEGTRGLSSND